MQAIIMAAGKGSRLGALTKECPKSFLEIKGKKLIEYNIQMLHKYGIKDIIIVTGYKCEAFTELAKNIEGIKLIFNPFYEMVNVLGSFWMAQDELHDDFIYMHADTICDVSIFEELLAHKEDVVLPVDCKPCDDEAMKVRYEKGEIVEITKNMDCSLALGEFIGIAKIRGKMIPMLKEKSTELMKEKAFDSYFEAAIQKVIDEKKCKIASFDTKGAFWIEVDFKEDYERAIELMPQVLSNM